MLASEPIVIPLLENVPPSTLPAFHEVHREKDAAHPNRFISEIHSPTITIFSPDPRSEQPTPAVMICPGGGYAGVAIDKEGFDVARWLNSIGITAVVLMYRMPDAANFHPQKNDPQKNQKPLPLIDSQKAIEIIRAHATEWNIDSRQIGILGFSAGGHLAALTATETTGPRVDFLILIYPVISMFDPVAHAGSRKNLLGDSPDPKSLEAFSNQLRVDSKTPPTLLVHAKDDSVSVKNSELFFDALQKNRIDSQLILFENGGHGFGLGVNGGEPATWPDRCAIWLREHHFSAGSNR